MQKARRQDKFDYVAPIIILEGMKFYDEFLMNIFKSWKQIKTEESELLHIGNYIS